jgi:hypothetical protein
MATSRRQSPRLKVEALIDGALSRGSLEVTLIDLGFGGFAVEAPLEFTSGTRHGFRFVTARGVSVQLKAEVVYSRATGERDGMESHITGFKYTISEPADQRSVDILIDTANSPLTFC